MAQVVCRHLLRKHAAPALQQQGMQGEKLEDYVRTRSTRAPTAWPAELAGIRVFPLVIWEAKNDGGDDDHDGASEDARDHDAFVDRCVLAAALASSGSGKYHKRSVLALGSRLSKGTLQKRGENAVVSFVKTAPWRALRRAVGDAFVRHLLLETAMFWRDGTPTLVQLSGPLLNAQLWSAGADLLLRNAGPTHPRGPTLDRHKMFYAANFNRRVGLPKTHELNRAEMNAQKLSEIIFAGRGLARGEVRQHRIWAGVVLKNHRKCPYGGLLRRHCPTPGPKGDRASMPNDTLSLAVPPAQVATYLKAVLLRLLGRAPLTCARKTRRRLLEAVHAFAHLPRNASFNLGAQASQIGLGKDLVEWIFTRLLVPLTKVCFYCTEGTGIGMAVVYFRKPVWAAACQRELANLKEAGILYPDEGSASSSTASTMSRLRFVPKANGGLRPIMNCKGLNFRLSFVSHALKAAYRSPHRDANPNRPRIMGLHEFYPLYRDFVQRIRDAGGPGAMHILTMDVEKCFDNLDQDMVCRAVRELLEQEDYVISGYNQVFVSNKIVGRIRTIAHRTIELYAKGVDAGDMEPTFGDIFERARASTTHCVLIDRAEAWHVDRREIIRKVAQHIKTNRTKFGDAVFRQSRGIPQGSILSSLLCSICLDRFEAQHADPILFAPSKAPPLPVFCVRMLDDFLVLSPDRERVLAFQREMECGFPEYGIRVKPAKTQISPADEPAKVAWCGLTIDNRTLSVSLDPDRLDLRHPSAASTGVSAREQLRRAAQIILLRATPVLFDRTINPPAIAEQNLVFVLRLAKAKLDRHAREACAAKLVTFVYRLLLSRTKSNLALTRPHVRRIVCAELLK